MELTPEIIEKCYDVIIKDPIYLERLLHDTIKVVSSDAGTFYCKECEKIIVYGTGCIHQCAPDGVRFCEQCDYMGCNTHFHGAVSDTECDEDCNYCNEIICLKCFERNANDNS